MLKNRSTIQRGTARLKRRLCAGLPPAAARDPYAVPSEEGCVLGAAHVPRPSSHARRGAVLILTLFLILLASFALSRFIERAYSEILAEAVFLERDRLRVEAYSALEATLGVLFDVYNIDRAFHAPSQGWGDPLAYAGYQAPEGMTIHVSFEDEMAKIPLPAANALQLQRLFEYLGFMPRDAEDLADSLVSWVDAGHQESSFSANHLDYERSETPYRPPHRPMRSLYELAAINGFREWFFDEQAVPNELFHRFASLVSLYQFNQVNVNSASPSVLQIWSELGESEVAGVHGLSPWNGDHAGGGIGAPLYFRDLQEASTQMQLPFNSQQYGANTICIRVNVTVREGAGEFHLSTVVAPPGAGANQLRPPGQIQPAQQAQQEQEQQQQAARQQRGRQAGRRGQAAPGAQPVPYPFQFLEIRENESIL